MNRMSRAMADKNTAFTKVEDIEHKDLSLTMRFFNATQHEKGAATGTGKRQPVRAGVEPVAGELGET